MGHHQRAYDLPAGFGRDLARALSRIGRDDFYESVIDTVAPPIPCDFWIMARYETAAQPRILSESGMAPRAKSAYVDKLWRRGALGWCADGNPRRCRQRRVSLPVRRMD